MMVEIFEVEPESIAEKAGIKPGDKLIAINNKKVKDYIDYQYQTSDDNFTLKISRNGINYNFKIEKNINENLGIRFNKIIFDNLKTCNNNCIFCFIDQLPEGLRDSLYRKDDDYRFSFLQGSFITLTNLTAQEWNRILQLKLSPLNISVHTTNSDLRIKMLNNKQAGKIMEQLKKLANAGLKFNTQIVLCPGLNDGRELEQTIKDLKTLYPAIISLGIVPAGITRYNSNEQLKCYTKNMAKKVLKQIKSWQNKLQKEFNHNWLYAADELYLLANEKLPEYEKYNDFPQWENGIGITRQLWYNFKQIKNKLPDKISTKKHISIITGKLGKKGLKPVEKELLKIKNLKVDIVSIPNNFFGETVTVTGLITGKDIINTLKNKKTSKHIILPGIIFNKNDFLLDDLTLKDIRSLFPDKYFYRCDTLEELIEVIK